MREFDPRLILLHHAGLVNYPFAHRCFLKYLRPYQGINQECFIEIVEAVIALYPEFSLPGKVDKEIVAAVWGLCHTARSWALQPWSMLRRNSLISNEEASTLSCWLDIIERISLEYLRGVPICASSLPYVDYLAECKVTPVHEYKFTVPLLMQSLGDEDEDVRISAAKALRNIGEAARIAIPALRKLAEMPGESEARSEAQKTLEVLLKSGAG